jgi:lipopolysaccharide export system permease protein
VLKQNVAATVREKVFWDDIPGIVMYTEHYDEEHHSLKGVVIHDGRELDRPMTIFAAAGIIGGGPNRNDIRLVLNNGSIHSVGTADEYRLVHFGEYIMTIGGNDQSTGFGKNELDMTVVELCRQIDNPATTRPVRLKTQSELHSRFAFPFASLVFAVVAVPLGMQNRRSGKSAGFSTSIGILLAYYVIQSLLRTLAERGSLPPALALWLPNIIFLGLGWYLLRMASQEQSIRILLPTGMFRRKAKTI